MSDDTLPQPKHCTCGYMYRWYQEEQQQDDSVFWEIEEQLGFGHFRQVSDVVERPCPHRNGTVIEFCPGCDRKVGMWGCGPAGGMECDCWEAE